jgi:uncharacterized protein YcbX
MKQEVGIVKAIYRYPVKSMAGERLATAALGWHGIEGDRRFAFRRVQETGGFPWLTAGRLPALIRYQPYSAVAGNGAVPTHVRTPSGAELELSGAALQQELSAVFGAEVQLMQLNHGMFDEAPLSLISTATLGTLAARAECAVDARRFRPNILIETITDAPFPEDAWLGKLVVFGEQSEAPAMSVAQRDVRCTMINLDPETGTVTPQVLKATVKTNQNCAGVYGATFRCGELAVGSRVFLLDV